MREKIRSATDAAHSCHSAPFTQGRQSNKFFLVLSLMVFMGKFLEGMDALVAVLRSTSELVALRETVRHKGARVRRKKWHAVRVGLGLTRVISGGAAR